MSERTAPALAKLDEWLTHLKSLPPSPQHNQMIEEGDALRRAVSAFHMEGIRFRMHSLDRLHAGDADENGRRLFGELRHALEAGGFHTRSHTAP